MILFVVCAAAMAAAAVAILAPALRGRRPAGRGDRAAQNIEAARRRLQELEHADDDPDARAEVERALLEDLDAGDGENARRPKTPGKTVTAVILAAIPAAAAALYLWLGAPEALLPRPPAPVNFDSAAPSLDEAQAQLERALAADPANKNALMLAALAAEAAGDPARAAGYLRRLLPLVADAPETQAEVQAMLARMQQLTGGDGGDGDSDGGDGDNGD